MELRRLVRDNFGFLNGQYGFQEVDAVTSEHFGNEYLLLKSGDICLQWIRDRAQVFLEIKRDTDPESKFYSLDLIKHVLDGKPEFYGIVEGDNIRFIQENFAAIMDLFSAPRFADTEVKLKQAHKLRFKWMWK
jgi:hypothetical protein